MDDELRKHNECRICKSKNLKQFLNLGEMPLANSFLSREDLKKPESKFPLRVLFCNECGLSQLEEVINSDILFRNYVYLSSGMPKKFSEHFKNYADEVISRFIKSKDDLVVEIGSNDGILLSVFLNKTRILGIDPAENVAKIATENGIETIADYFSENLAAEIVKKYGHARAIMGNNVVMHIDDHHDLMKGVKTLLTNDGVFIFEAPYMRDMFDNLTFDTIYHEHLSYLTVKPFSLLFKQFGMEIIDIKEIPVHGVSLRVYAAKTGAHEIKPAVAEYLKREEEMGFDKFETYLKLAERIGELKEKVVNNLTDLKSKGKKIAGYGAPAKGNTLLNYFNIGPEILDYATEALPSKIGLYTPGTHIPVIDIEEARKNPPDYYLLLAWNYKDVILEKEKEFRQSGGKFIMPIGDGEII